MEKLLGGLLIFMIIMIAMMTFLDNNRMVDKKGMSVWFGWRLHSNHWIIASSDLCFYISDRVDDDYSNTDFPSSTILVINNNNDEWVFDLKKLLPLDFPLKAHLRSAGVRMMMDEQTH